MVNGGSQLFTRFMRKRVIDLKKQAPPGLPPRQGLVWKPQTRRWIRPKTPSTSIPLVTIPSVRIPSGRAREDILSRVYPTPATHEIEHGYSGEKVTIQYAGTPSPWVDGGSYSSKGRNYYNSAYSPIRVNRDIIQDHVSDLASRILDSGKIKYTGDRQKLKEDLRREIISSEVLDDLGIDQIPDFEEKINNSYGTYRITVDLHEGITQDANTHLSDIINLQIEDFIVSYTDIPEFDKTKSLVHKYENKINRAFKKVIREAVKNHDENKIPLETLQWWKWWDKWDPKHQRIEDDLLYNPTARSSKREGPDSSFLERKPIALQDWVRNGIIEEIGINLLDEPAHEMRAIHYLKDFLEDAGNEFALYQARKVRGAIEDAHPSPFDPSIFNSSYRDTLEQHPSVPRTARNPEGWRRKDGDPIIQFSGISGKAKYQLARNSSEEDVKVK